MLMRRPEGQGARCGLPFRPGALWAVRHREGDHAPNTPGDLDALHRHGPDQLHGRGAIEPQAGIQDQDWPFEEPYERASLRHDSEDPHAG